MHKVGDLVNLLLKHSKRIWIRDHQRGNVFIHLRRQSGHIDHAAVVRFQIFYRVTDRGRCRRIRAMRGVGNQNFLTGVAFRFVIGADHEQSSEFALRTGGGLQGDGVHAGDFQEAVAEGLHDTQSALRNFLGLIRMSVGEAFHARDEFVHARVVLHGAGA